MSEKIDYISNAGGRCKGMSVIFRERRKRSKVEKPPLSDHAG